MNLNLGYQIAERIVNNASSSAVSVYEIQREESRIKDEEGMSDLAQRTYNEHKREHITKMGSLYATSKWLCTMYNAVGQSKIKCDEYFNRIHTIVHHRQYAHINRLVGDDILKTFKKGLPLIVQQNDFGIPSRDLDMMIVAAEDYYAATENLKSIPDTESMLSDVWGEMTMSDIEKVEYMSNRERKNELLAIKNNKFELFKSVGDNVIRKIMSKSDCINLAPDKIRNILTLDRKFKAPGLGDYNVNAFDLGYNIENCIIIRMFH